MNAGLGSIDFKDPVKTNTEHFMRYTVRVDAARIFALKRVAKEKGVSPDALLSDIIDRSFDEYVKQDPAKLGAKNQMNVAIWKGRYLTRAQLSALRAMSALAKEQRQNGNLIIATYSQIAGEAAKQAGAINPRQMGQSIPSLIEKGLVGKLFIKKVGKKTGSPGRDLNAFVIYADMADVEML